MSKIALNRDQLIRYSRQLMLDGMGVDGQQRLQAARVLIIGAGGLGSASAMSLAGLGVGTLVLADHDHVEAPNLHRQLLHDNDDTGRLKVDSAADTLRRINPDIQLELIPERVTAASLEKLVGNVDVVVDGCDNFDTRFAVNDACVRLRRPLVSGAAIRYQGQVAVFRPDRTDQPCYRCLYPQADDTAETCAVAGILPPIVGIIGNHQALETVKIITGIGEDLAGRLLLFDALQSQWRSVRLRRDPHCPACGQAPANKRSSADT